MDVIIQSPGIKINELLENAITEQLQSLPYEGLIRAQVVLYTGPVANTENAYCEIRLEMPGNDPFVKRKAASFETAFQDCMDTLKEILSRSKGKMAERSKKDPSAIQDAIDEAEKNIDPDLEDVVRQ